MMIEISQKLLSLQLISIVGIEINKEQLRKKTFNSQMNCEQP